jgi:hypothetical protein
VSIHERTHVPPVIFHQPHGDRHEHIQDESEGDAYCE